MGWAMGLVVVASTTGCYEGYEGRAMELYSSEARPRAGAVYAECGTRLAEVDGVWAYSNGDDTTTGNSCTGDYPNAVGAYEYQCVELAQRYMHEIHGIATRWPVAAAKDMCTKQPAGVTTYWPGYAPSKGDLAVWTEGTWGHVAVVAEVLPEGIRIVEQNSSAAGTRMLYGNPHDGYKSDWGTSPGCYVHADSAPMVAPPEPASGDVVPPAQCDALGYEGECRGDTSVWSDGGKCLVRDCASEGKTCGFIAEGVGFGCLGGSEGSSVFDCGDVGFEGICNDDGTLVWAEGGACHVVSCRDLGRGCGWTESIGYDCQ